MFDNQHSDAERAVFKEFHDNFLTVCVRHINAQTPHSHTHEHTLTHTRTGGDTHDTNLLRHTTHTRKHTHTHTHTHRHTTLILALYRFKQRYGWDVSSASEEDMDAKWDELKKQVKASVGSDESGWMCMCVCVCVRVCVN